MPSQMEDVQLTTPSYTSSKTGFNVAPSGRGDDAPRPMEVVTNEQFRDEDRFTNATKDPRIGTHGRKYEP